MNYEYHFFFKIPVETISSLISKNTEFSSILFEGISCNNSAILVS